MTNVDQLTENQAITDVERLAIQLMQLTVRPRYKEILEQHAEVYVNEIGEGAKKEQFMAAIEEVLPLEEALMWQADLYARSFSASELEALIAFHSSDVGRKSDQLIPVFAREIAERTISLLSKRLPAALVRHGLVNY